MKQSQINPVTRSTTPSRPRWRQGATEVRRVWGGPAGPGAAEAALHLPSPPRQPPARTDRPQGAHPHTDAR